MTEIWKPIAGYEGKYEVSNKGNVRSLDRDEPTSRGYVRHRKGKKIIPHFSHNGYLYVGLYKDSKLKNHRVSRLVCQAFLPEDYSEELTVDHINGNILDNRVENLQCITNEENIRKAWQDGTNDKQKKRITLKRISDGTVFEFKSFREAARALNTSHTRIRWAKKNNKEVKGYVTL